MAEKAKGTKPRQTGKKPASAPSDAPETERHAEPELYDRVQQRAYEIWEREGRPHGRDDEHWQRAEREIRDEVQVAPARPRARKDTSGAVARPEEGGKPGASGELGGTPGAPATGSGGRQTPSGRRRPGGASS
jgi:hypothetical protein